MELPEKYFVTVSPVREISVLGTARYEFWREQLQSEGLGPWSTADGKAQLLLVCADMKFLGIPFQELSVSVFVESTGFATDHQAVFLVQAFNTRTCFAWFERTLFHTPYWPGAINMTLEPTVRLTLQVAGCSALRLEMSADPGRAPTRTGEDGWEGPIFLPTHRPKKGAKERLFFARIRGETAVYERMPKDVLVINPVDGYPIFQQLVDSEFTIQQWMVRPRAVHSKSKTVTWPRAGLASSRG